jgi:hypothetical protein
MDGKPCWQAIPVKSSLEQFEEFVLPHLSRGRRGPPPKLALHKIFYYIQQARYMGCQWKMRPIERNAKGRPEIHYTRIYRVKSRGQTFLQARAALDPCTAEITDQLRSYPAARPRFQS